MLTDYQMREIEKAEDILTRIYWYMQDNRESKREAKRLDTILGKLWELKNLNEKG